MTVLKEHRLAKGLSMRQVGQRIGCSVAAVGFWETGRSVPSAAMVPKIARVLGINRRELVRLIVDAGQKAA